MSNLFVSAEGKYPYAAHLVGTFQPLIGWVSHSYKEKIKQTTNKLYDHYVKAIESDIINFKYYGLKDISPGDVPEAVFNKSTSFLNSMIKYEFLSSNLATDDNSNSINKISSKRYNPKSEIKSTTKKAIDTAYGNVKNSRKSNGINR